MSTTEKLNADTDPERVSLRGKLRRFVITLTSKALWQVTGFALGAGGTQEVMTAELFGGIGISARPPDGKQGRAEAIIAMLGNDGKTPVIVAVRDEKTRAAIAQALNQQADETVLFNSKAVTYVKADGTIEIRTPTGTAEKMAKGETLVNALVQLATAQAGYNTAVAVELNTLAMSPVMSTNLATMQAASNAFINAAASYLATVGKVE